MNHKFWQTGFAVFGRAGWNNYAAGPYGANNNNLNLIIMEEDDKKKKKMMMINLMKMK